MKIITKIKSERKFLLAIILFSFILFSSSNVFGAFNNPTQAQFSSPDLITYYNRVGFNYNTIWPDFNNPDKCQANQDFIVNIRPGSCMPAVVRSDLLEEQNVPVFCQLDATKINPLIATNKIKRVYIKINNQSNIIAGASYYPSKSAAGAITTSITNPLLTDIGYVVVNIRSMKEKDMPDHITANLTAVIEYDVENAFGIGQGTYYLPVLTEDEWNNEYVNYGFWKGKGFLRLEYVDENEARISIYKDKDTLYKSVVVKKGQPSEVIFIPGFYCQAGLKINFVDQEIPKTRALIEFDGVDKWVVENEKIQEGCVINRIDKETNQIEVTCRGKKQTLSTGFSNYVKINNNDVKIGGLLNAANKDYLLYYGKTTILDNKKENKIDFVVIAKNVKDFYTEDGKIKERTLENIKKIIDAKKSSNLNKDDFIEAINSSVARELGVEESNILVIEKGKSQGDYTFNDIIIIEKTKEDYGNQAESIEKYFNEAKKTTEEIVDSYKNEKITEGSDAGEYYGSLALFNLAETAEKIGKQLTEKELLEKLIQNYPDSKLTSEAERKINILEEGYDYSSASSFFEIDGETHIITLKKIEYPTIEQASAEFDIYNKDGTEIKKSTDKIEIGNQIYDNEKIILRLEEIQKDKAIISYKYKNDKDDKDEWIEHSSITLSISNDKPTIISEGDISIKLVKVTADYVAKINIVPEIKNGKTEADFILNVGIEKRAIKLTPEETKERIANLNKSIEKFEKITNNLGNIVKTWKAACFATATIINVKNMFANIGGKATARQHVMQDSGGWTEKCEELMKKEPENYKTLDECFYKNKDKINSDVEKVTNIINEINNQIKTAQIGTKNSQDVAKNFANSYFKDFVKQNGDVVFGKDKNNKDLNLLDVFGNDESKINELIDNGLLTTNDMRDIIFSIKTNQQVSNELQSLDFGKKELSNNLKTVYEIQKNIEEKQKAKEGAQSILPGSEPVTLYDKNMERVNIKVVNSGDRPRGDLESNTNYVSIIYNGDPYFIPVKQEGEGSDKYSFDKKESILNGTGNKLDREKNTEIYEKATEFTFVQITEKSCQNVYELVSQKIEIYDTEPFKGMPKLVPFDLKRGWYIATKPSISFLGTSSKAYSSSGMLSTFYLCNVGENQREEFERGGDDICTRIDMNTNQPLDEFPCLSDRQDAINTIKKGISTVENVIRAYSNGDNGINIDGTYFRFERAVNIPNMNCQDYMSPEDCNLLFNVCDPVLCPASRCNLGGNWPTNDVVQEGIIGGLVLCLPNGGSPSEGKVLVPVCLTGIYAGLDAYTSVLKAHRDCLQESLDTGKMTGICDEMYSIYVCEFFWKQAAPLLRFGIPKLIEKIYGTTQGGGEYLTIQDSWKNMEKSFNYFTNVYGVNAFEAFRKRSTGSIGTEVCKSFISANYPTGAETLNQLLEPESPVQFYARFDEIPFSDATPTPTSQYKVYYHIYAGRDSGTYYSIYLKATSASTQFFNLQDSILVKTGYVAAGQYVDETKDFTAPSGYKELCVRINDQDKCGFGQVTTDYALNYLTDQYAAEQANKTDINSEEECISGTSSYYSLANPNLQEGVSNYLNPSLSNIGIVRVCSTGEPGGTTYSSNKEATAKWVMVGWCDKKNNIKCWANTESIKNSIYNLGLENKTLQNLKANQEEIFKELGIAGWAIEDEKNKLEELSEKAKDAKKSAGEGTEPSLDYLKLVDEFLQKSSNDNLKVIVLYNKFEIYNKLVNYFFEEYKKAQIAETTKPQGGQNQGEKPAEKTETTQQPQKVITLKEDGDYLKIYLDGEYTNLFIEETKNGYILKKNDLLTNANSDPKIGAILRKTNGGYILNLDGIGEKLLSDKKIDKNDLEKAINDHLSKQQTQTNTLKLVYDSSLRGYGVLLNGKKTGLYFDGVFSILYDENGNEIGETSDDYKTIILTSEEGDLLSKKGIDIFKLESLVSQKATEQDNLCDYGSDLGIIGAVISSNTNFCPIINFCETCNDFCGSRGVSKIYKQRYAKYKDLFDKYSSPPYLPKGISKESFKALLAAISKKESSMGNAGENKFTGCSHQGYIGNADLQLRCTAKILKDAFEGTNDNYKTCYSKTGNDKIYCILSIYNQGDINDIGKIYAKKTLYYYGEFHYSLCKNELV